MKVEVYGGDHSPWVQAVLLALHEKKIDKSERLIPPFDTLKQWGLLQPAVSIDGRPWEIESTRIITKFGFDPIPDEDLTSVRRAWQGVIHRADNPFHFFASFAHLADPSPSLVRRIAHRLLFGFIAFYMFVLLNFAKRTRNLRQPEDFGDQFLVWERALKSSAGPFLDGDAPGSRDLLLFGIIQCHCSIPVPPLDALLEDERLGAMRLWIGRMQERFRDYPHLYSGRYFAPFMPQPKPASFLQRAVFYFGLLTTIAAFPITLPLVFVLMHKVPR